MSYIRNIAPGVIRYTCGLYSRKDLQNAQNTVARDLATNNLSIDDLKNNILLLDFLAEGHDDKVIQPLIDYLATIAGIDKIRVLFTAAIEVSKLPYRARSFVTHFTTWDGRFVNDGNQETVQLETKFLCLARRPSWARARFLSQLLNEVPDIRASFGSGFYDPSMIDQYKSYFPNHSLPIMLSDSDARSPNYFLASAIFQTCLFNIIVETSNQNDTSGWNSIFLTEKTFKCFDLYQLPIWFAVPGTVAQVRQLGFDLFDDIIDHGYDDIIDEAERINSIITQVKNLDNKFSLADCQNLRNTMYPRLKANLAVLDGLTANYTQTNDQLINELLT